MARVQVVAPTEPAELHPDLAGWYRRGGRRCTVHVTADELAAAVRAGLVEDLGPWRLTGSDAVPGGVDGRHQEHPWAEDDVAFDRHGRTASGQYRINLWVWSAALPRSHPPLSAGTQYEMHCSFNGFLLVQHCGCRQCRPPWSRPLWPAHKDLASVYLPAHITSPTMTWR